MLGKRKMSELAQASGVKITKANTRLKQLVGTGSLTSSVLDKMEKTMENLDIDFEPEAKRYLKELAETVVAATKGEQNKDILAENMIKPVMKLKAEAAMFDYPLISKLANIMMHFLEELSELDDDVIQIVAAHQKTLNLIVVKKMTGEGGNMGKMLIAELEAAIERYKEAKGL